MLLSLGTRRFNSGVLCQGKLLSLAALLWNKNEKVLLTSLCKKLKVTILRRTTHDASVRPCTLIGADLLNLRLAKRGPLSWKAVTAVLFEVQPRGTYR
jgi:hypothetical protein